MYFSLNQDDYTFALSCQAVCNATGMSDSTYKKAVRELVSKGYLVKSKTKGLYIFYEGTENSPDRSIEINRQEEEKDTTENKKQTVQKVKKNSSRGVKNNGEIIQDNTNNNTLNNTETASPKIASLEEKKKLVIECYLSGMSYKKENPEIQNATGLNGKLIHNIIQDYCEDQDKQKQKAKGKQIPLIDGTLSDYYTKEFKLDKEDLPNIYTQMVGVGSYYRFKKEFVDQWLLEEYGYKHKAL
jgi:DNA-binding transcriptional regulator YhcF (GntR family)